MKNRISVLLLTVCAIIAVVLSFSSCTNESEISTTASEETTAEAATTVIEETTPADEITTFDETTTAVDETTVEEITTIDENADINITSARIYLPDNANAWEKAAARTLAEKLSGECTDNLGAANIVVGKQCLDEKFTAKADYAKIGCNGYANYVTGGKAVLTSKTETGIAKAIDEFTSNAITEQAGQRIVANAYAKSEDEQITVVQPDTSKHLDVVMSTEFVDVYKVPELVKFGYRYGPSIIVNEDGTMDAWFASTGSGGTSQWDWITYRHSEDGVNWTDEICVLQPTPNGLDHWSCCDPGVFRYNGYYYIGYTSTVNSNQKDNCVFVARSENPDGPYEKWNGNGWGGNDPQPIVYFDESTELWGSGEPSFVELNGTLYIYYTWMGGEGRETWVSTADATDDNWPATMQFRDIAVTTGNNDSIDVKYMDEYGKFIAIATDQRMTASSYLLFFESNDGIHFTKTDICKKNTAFYCHNSGISGTANGHITKGMQVIAGYAYGEGWGIWNTRFQKCTIKLADSVDLSETKQTNLRAQPELDKRDSDSLPIASITMGDKNDSINVSKARDKFGLNVLYATTYQNKWYSISKHPDAKEIKYSEYDENIVKCTDGTFAVEIVGDGATIIRIDWKGFTTYAYVKIFNSKAKDNIVGIEPLVKSEFTVDMTNGRTYLPQIKAKVLYENTDWAEMFGSDVEYSGYDTSIIKIDSIGQIHGLKPGTTEVTVSKNGFSYKVKVTVIGNSKSFDYTNIEFESGNEALKIIKATNNAQLEIKDGVLVCTPTTPSDPIATITYVGSGLKADDYGSVTITYKIPTGLSAKAFKGQLFFMCGSNNSPAEDMSQKYDMTADGEWHEVTVDFSGNSKWTGEINSIRYDFFDSCAAGDYLMVKSIVLNKK